jgi:acetate---CoA ligase (ADP-forming)
MKDFFYPKSIAIVGTSENPEKLGTMILNNLLKGGFEGEVYPINKKSKEISGLKVHKKVSDIPKKVDLVCIVVPALHVLNVVRDCAKKKVKGIVIISAGFKETGKEGKILEGKITAIAKKYKIRILGPNCLGFINNFNKTNLSFAANKPLKGNIAFFSQSGAFCTAILDMSIPKNLGFSYFVSIGNKADINEIDLFNYYLEDSKVKVISAYLEDIVDGSKLIQNYEQSKNKKPIIILKAGQTDESKKAIESHTGSIAGSIEMFRTGIKQAGIIEAHNTRQLFNYMMMFSWSKPLLGKKIAIVTNAGGPGIIATDSIIRNGFEMSKIPENVQITLKKFLPPESSVANPIDVIGDATAERYRYPIELLAQSKDVDAIIVLLTPQLVTQIEETTKLILTAVQLYNKPIIPVFLGKKYIASGLQRFFDNKMPAFTEIDDAIISLKALRDYHVHVKDYSKEETKKKWKKLDFKKEGNFSKELRKFTTSETKTVPDKLTEDIASEIGFTLPKQIITKEFDKILEFAEDNYPIVLKVGNEVLAHKTDFKGIYLGITNEKELKKNHKKLEKDIYKLLKLDTFTMIAQEQLSPEVEFFIGAHRDGNAEVYDPEIPGFGHLIVFGQGGIYTEIYKDFGYVLVPASKNDIRRGLAKTKIYQILKGARGQKPLNIEKIINQIYAVQKLTLLYPEIVSIDINPLIVTKNDVVAVDVKMFASY